MIRSVLVAAALAVIAPNLWVPAPAHAQRGPGARIWVEDERDYFRRGDRMQVRFTTHYDAYVAVIHIDTDGTLDFLYPTSPWDDGYVRGGEVYSVPRGSYSSWSVRSRPGIGYLYVIASDQPLDYTYFGGPHAGSWDWSFAGRNVRGDPYLALEQITRMLVADWRYGGYSVDYYSYHVDRRYNYPSYACGSSGWGGSLRGWGWTPHYGSCSQIIVFLRDYPGYYDTRRYRGDRLVYLRGGDLPEVRHGFKAPARETARGREVTQTPRPIGRSAGTPAPARPPMEQPSRRRPTLERRDTSEPAAPAQTPRARGAGGGSAQPPPPPSRRGSGWGSAVPAQRPTSRGSGGGAARPAQPPTSRGSSGGTARPAPAPASRGGATARPAATPTSRRSGGGTARPAPVPASRGSGGAAARPAPARGSSGGSERPAQEPRSRGGGGDGDGGSAYLPADSRPAAPQG